MLSLSRSKSHSIFRTAPLLSLSLLLLVHSLCPRTRLHYNIKRVIKFRNETAVLMPCLHTVCLMMKVTFSSVAIFQIQLTGGQAHGVSGGLQENKGHLPCLLWRSVELLMMMVAISVLCILLHNACCINKTAPPSGLNSK